MTNRRTSLAYRLLGLISVLIAGATLAADIPTASLKTLRELSATLSMPSDVAVGKNGNIYVVDGGNHQIAVFDASGMPGAVLGERGSEKGQFESPVGLGIGPKGNIYVADKGNHRLQVFDAKGRFRRSIALEEGGEKISPVDVAVSANGRELFVTANNSHRIVVYSSKGQFLRAWGGEGNEPGLFRFPATVSIDLEGNVLVVDVLNQRVQKFDTNGNLLATIGKLGGKAGTFFRPKGIAVDAAGRSYVSDSFLGVIQVFDAAGEFLHVLGEDGVATVFDTPVGLTVHNLRLYVVQMLPGNVLVLQLEAQ